MHKTKHQRRAPAFSLKIHFVVLSIASILSSFAMGVQTAGEVETVAKTAATNIVIPGDLNRDGSVDILDVTLILDIVRGNVAPSETNLLADPNDDGSLTVDDALMILRDLARRS